MGRWREMSQGEVDILAGEVGLTPVAMPSMNAKSKDKLERMQRKSSRPIGRGERVRTLRPATDAPAGERPSREPRAPHGEERPVREPRAPRTDDRPARTPRGEAPRRESPRKEAPRKDSGRGTPVAERPSDTNKRPAKPAHKRPGIVLVEDGPSGKRRGPPAGSGQRPGFGRRKPKPE
jgi:23S rRNA pseudouridine2605 synthase